MEIHKVYHPDFISLVTDTLNARCVDGAAVTRAELCYELGLSEPPPPVPSEPKAAKGSEETNPTWLAYNAAKAHNLTVEAVVGAMITLDVIQGFGTRKGPQGGIGRLGEKRSPSKDSDKKTSKNVEFPDGFLDNLVTTVNSVCIGSVAGTLKLGETILATVGTTVPRRDIAKAMGLPGSDTEVLISAALASGKLPGFASKRGANGGIVRLAPGVVLPEAAEASAEAVEPEAQATSAEMDDESSWETFQADDVAEVEVTEPEAAAEPAQAAETQPKAKKNKAKGKSKKS